MTTKPKGLPGVKVASTAEFVSYQGGMFGSDGWHQSTRFFGSKIGE
jgi:hypothetical protein